MLLYQLYNKGVQVDDYISSASWWDHASGPVPKGNAEMLCNVLGAPGDQNKVRQILSKGTGLLKYRSASMFHEDLLSALNYPKFEIEPGRHIHLNVNIGYKYLSAGPLPRQFISI